MGKNRVRFFILLLVTLMIGLSRIQSASAYSCSQALSTKVHATISYLGAFVPSWLRTRPLVRANNTELTNAELAKEKLSFANAMAKIRSSNLSTNRIVEILGEAIQLDRMNPEVWLGVGDTLYYLSIHVPQRGSQYLREAIRAYSNASELATDPVLAKVCNERMIAAEEKNGNELFLREYFDLVTSPPRVLTNSMGIDVEVPNISIDETLSPLAPSDRKLNTQFYISNRISQVTVVLQMLASMDDNSLREVLRLESDSESPSLSIVRVLPFMQAHLLSAIRHLAKIGDPKTALTDVGDLWELALLVPQSVGARSGTPWREEEVVKPFSIYSAALTRGFKSIAYSFYGEEIWNLMKFYERDSSRLRWSDLLTLSMLAKHLMKGQASPFEQPDLEEMRAKWASEGLAKFRTLKELPISQTTFQQIEKMFRSQ